MTLQGRPSPRTEAHLDALLEEDAEDLYENAPSGYLSTLDDGTIVKVNRTFLDWTGFTREDLVRRRRFQDLLTAGGKIYHETHYAPLLRMQGSVREIALEIVRGDGTRLPVLINAAVKRDDADLPLLVRVTIFNATDRREYERELLRARERAERSEARARLLAATLQESLIPPDLPTIPGLDLGAGFHPAGAGDEVGGDFYDVFPTTGAEWALIVGDVCGKGVPAAKTTARARYTVRTAAMRSRRPAVILRTLNDAILNDQDEDERFCTAVYARVRDHAAGGVRLTIASGGHPLPIVVGDAVDPHLIGRSGTLLGVTDRPALHDFDVALAPGRGAVFYTDGVTEARRANTLFGEGRLLELLSEAGREPAAVIAKRVVDDAVAFQEGAARDDIAVVVIKALA